MNRNRDMKGTRVTMDEETVLAEVYAVCPRVLCDELPTIHTVGDSVAVMIGDIFISEAGTHALFTVIDGANSTFSDDPDVENIIYRTIGPVDLADYGGTAEGLREAVKQAYGTFTRSMRADWN